MSEVHSSKRKILPLTGTPAAVVSPNRISRGLLRPVVLAAIALTVLAVAAAARTSLTPQPRSPSAPSSAPWEPIVPIPRNDALNPKRVALGEQLFHEVELSRDRARSCATCHPPEHGGMDGRTRPFTASGALHVRNTPTVFNVGLSSAFNWDGAASTLEAHAETVLRNPSLMDITWPEVLARLGAEPQYVSQFRDAYPDGLTPPTVLDALATFERSLTTPDSRFDRYLRGEGEALTGLEQRGYALFKAYGCVTCHQGINIGGNMFQKFGVFAAEDVQQPNVDLGRYYVTRASRDRGVFRVPSLRNVALTAPYFHDGRARSLSVAVDTMAKVQLGRTLRAEESVAIVQFLNTLTGRYRGEPLSVVTPPTRSLIESP